jgi:hypothetical protein
MGFDFTQDATKQDVINEQVAESSSTRTVAFQVRANVLWAIKESKYNPADRWIYYGVMKLHRGYGWGFKGMEEGMGPAYYNCPVEYLDQVTLPSSSYAEAWRARVRETDAKSGRSREGQVAPANPLYTELFGTK